MCDGTKWAMQACVPLNNTKEQYAQILSGLAANDLSIDACKSTQEGEFNATVGCWIPTEMQCFQLRSAN
jgi:hypothetical protein